MIIGNFNIIQLTLLPRIFLKLSNILIKYNKFFWAHYYFSIIKSRIISFFFYFSMIIVYSFAIFYYFSIGFFIIKGLFNFFTFLLGRIFLWYLLYYINFYWHLFLSYKLLFNLIFHALQT